MAKEKDNQTVSIDILNYAAIQKILGKDLEKRAKTVVRHTVSDVKSRAPGWVSQEVMKKYNVKKKDINTTIKSRKKDEEKKEKGSVIIDAEIKYEGGLMTPTHFQMKPTKRYKHNKKYTVTAQVKSARKSLGEGVFLASNHQEHARNIPFQRVAENRLPVEVIKTVSVPQMVTNDKVGRQIQKRLTREMNKRLAHNISREFDKARQKK